MEKTKTKKKRAGRPKGSKNKTTISKTKDGASIPIRRGRPAGTKRRGRPAGIKNNFPSLIAAGNIKGIHFIGKTLIVDTNEMDLTEVIFLGEGKTPKVR